MPSRPPYVFISYRHEPNTTSIATQFYDQLRMYRQGFGLDGVFLDKDKLAAGNVWRAEVEAALEKTTHFVAMLTNGYWLSDECHKELAFAVNRYRAGGPAAMRLLFVQVQKIAPELLAFDQPAADANAAFVNEQLGQAFPTLKTVGDLQFLGPFDDHARLIRLPAENDPLLSDALFQLMMRLKATLPAKI
ncbi:MAG TPA: toll/interleukin-1 receptor domain-containing protein [Accumulibacter sp.]|nr:toll/interleukin-1 receptor domain-containing protein [Accumulibacter sp.]HMW16523.1 toll/interleukin-1 receptor domain-containing protein [Accumulibacter sp.]HMX22159.1 toll/interleukin-1 receptor domain-containing protein [Accumulibacter sp.]HMY06128.1 toll/interleukin-1 receptor domain-containing protein [Accumulibacter sp.]HNC18650.1 toll/interleukin-1 receptor domain-containing protein [Accumulibacter sp.]